MGSAWVPGRPNRPKYEKHCNNTKDLLVCNNFIFQWTLLHGLKRIFFLTSSLSIDLEYITAYFIKYFKN
jgi:hypothetical protein